MVDALGRLLVEPLPDPLAAEVVAVPTRGMERWLTQSLSASLGAAPGRLDGVCANVDFPSPHRLVGHVVAQASGIDPAEDPWLPERALWSLLGVVDDCLAEPWLATLAAHLGGPADSADPIRRARRLSVVRHLANLFDRYALHRPGMVRAWAGQRDGYGTDGDVAADAGAAHSPPADAAWQAELWRRLRERIAQPSLAERLDHATARLHEEPTLVDLPERLSLFGLTRLPTGHMYVLRALAAARDVHLFMLHPSPALWKRVAETNATKPAVVRRADDATADIATNRLLASWGHDAREAQLVAAGGDRHVTHHHAVEQRADSLLARIQADLRADRAPAGAPLPGDRDRRPALAPDDTSLQVHGCHGRARQVEVLRDAILHLLDEDPMLEPRDVIVMCPDIETFAPLIHATFGAGEPAELEGAEVLPAGTGPPDLRVKLADRSLRQTNPVLGVVARLIDLADTRLTASEVLELADREPVRWRFGFGDDDLTRIQEWVGKSGIRWGLDAEHRLPYQLGDLDAGTWRRGLDRLLTGVAMTEDELRRFGRTLPLDDVDSGAIDLAGRLAELVDRLQASLDELRTPKPIDAWAVAIAASADSLTATGERDAWQRAELARLLGDVVEEASTPGTTSETALAPAELRALLADRLQGRPTRANFRTGHLTICTLVPMRSVPHRVVCLLGLDDGAFPRKSARDGDDLMLADPHVGERDPRTEDRQLLLDALLAARDHLIVTHTANDERTNAPQPPAVPIGELLDTVDDTVRLDELGDGPARGRVVVRHPLQTFDPRNFARGELLRERNWSFDPVARAGAQALTGPRAGARPFLAQRLPAVEATIIDSEDLVRFAAHPVRAFLRQRLGFGVGEFSDELEDDLRVELDGLEKWDVGQRLLDARLTGVERRTAVLAEIARGTLPPGVLGKPVVDEISPIVDALATAASEAIEGGSPPSSVDVRVELPGGRTVNGTIAGVSGNVLRTVAYSRLAPKHRLTAWVRLLVLTAAEPERPLVAATVGRSERRGRIAVARIRPPAEDTAGRREWALGQLETVVDLHARGLREPLPLYCATSAEYVRASRDPVAAARRAWTSEPGRYDREDREPEHRLVLSGVRGFDELLAESPRSDEEGDGWDDGERSRFGRYARRLWDGLLAVEEICDR